VLLIPRGRVDGRRWTVAAHCEQCHASRTSGSLHCPTCNVRGRVIAERTRCARGTRPFQPLETILGGEGARRFREKHALDR
jgi:DnaJ-class molecular chaperone